MGLMDTLKKGLAMIPKSGSAAGAPPVPVEKSVPGKAVTSNSGELGKAATEAVKRKKATEEALKATE